ncbi:unnamed protein product [Lampetra planeri]
MHAGAAGDLELASGTSRPFRRSIGGAIAGHPREEEPDSGTVPPADRVALAQRSSGHRWAPCGLYCGP